MRALLVLVLAACGTRAAAPTAKPAPPKPIVAPAPTLVDVSALTGAIQDVRVETADATLRGQVASELASVVGKPLTHDVLREPLNRVMRVSGVADVVVRGVQLVKGVALVVEVTPYPIVRKLEALEAGKPVSLGVAALASGARLDPMRVHNLVASLRDRYIANGFLDAAVTWRRVPAGDVVDVVIDVSPGQAATIAAVQFTGNAAVDSKRLGQLAAKSLLVGEPPTVGKIESAVAEINAYYWDNGYANVKVVAPKPQAGPNTLVFAITEGPKFRIGTVKVTGKAPAEEHKKLIAAFGLKKGDVFNRRAIAEGRDRVSKAAGREVLPLTKVDMTKRTIDLTLEIF